MCYNILIVEFVNTLLILGGLGYLIKQNKELKRKLNIIMGTQEDFDVKIGKANEALATIAVDMASVKTAIDAEAQQIAEFIAANPGVDTSALDGVVARLGGVADDLGTTAGSVEGIFTPPAEG